MTSMYLEVDDEVTSIIDKLKKEKSTEITFVIPKNATILQSVVNLKILLSEATRLGKRVFIVTPDKNGKHLAARAGFAIKQELRRDRVEHLPESAPQPSEFTGDEGELHIKQDQADREVVLEDTQPSWISERVKQRLQKAFNDNGKNGEHARGSNKEFAQENERAAKQRKQGIFENKRKRLRRKKVKLLPRATLKLILLIVIPLSLIFGLVATLLLPTASISITPKSEPITRTMQFSLRGQAISTQTQQDIQPKQILPTTIIIAEDELSQQFPATGEKKVGDKATGNVQFTNSFSSDSEKFPKGTKLISDSGKTYLLVAAVTVPGAEVVAGEAVSGSVNAQIEAETPGEEFNVERARFTIQGISATKQKDVFAQAKTPIQGGNSRTVKAVSQTDVASARTQLEKTLTDKLTVAVKEKISEGYTTGDGGIQTESLEAVTSAPVDGEAEQFDLHIKMRASAFTFSETEAQTAINNNLTFDIPEQKHLVENQGGITYTIRDINLQKQEAILDALVEKKLVWDIDTASISDQLRGKSKQDAENYLKTLKTIQASSVSFWPFWVNEIPQFSKKIHIRLDNL